MTANTNEIPTGELFADLQVSLTEIFLIELLGDGDEHRSRLNGNCQIRDAIGSIMRERFTAADIAGFLENGFPRAVALNGLLRDLAT